MTISYQVENTNITNELLIQMYSTMLKIRMFEEKIIEVYPVQDMQCPVHLCIGEEAIAAGVCLNLKKEDYIFSTHRNHGHCVAKGSDMKLMMAEFYGKKTGYSKGKGGSMHMVDPENGILGTSAIVGGAIPLAVGTALASAMKKDGRVSAAFFGDGAAEEGTFHESLNFASLKKLPVVFVCENNFYATNSYISARQPHNDIAKKAESYLIPSVQIDGNDVVAVYEEARKAVERARAGKGPSFIECRTYRWKGHVGPDCDYEKGCRPKEELDVWMDRCPVKTFEDFILKNKSISEKELQQLKANIAKELDNAVSYGRTSPLPDDKELFEDVYA
ncbi:MAG: thiamine pyrophosphate-dependent dehydrogenase E1 component subunit alpha [Deltaproteobacteria bacterium]|nr:thiamine pyrophosphate-dependent dehydrogenase E1 component subunit alpha [Deltaproteobacteria bacterium]